MSARKYTAAIAGCGSIAHAHMSGYENAGIEVIACADPLPIARGEYQERYGIPQGFATVTEMMAKAKPDLVSVCTWHPDHPAPAIDAAKGGAKGVICEKPMAISTGLAKAMIDAAEASGTKLVISHQRRFTPGWEKGRELVQGGAIGKPLWVNCKVINGLLNCGTHAIDGARFVLGDPRAEWVMGAVSRYSERFERATPIEDACMALVQLEGGLQLFIQSDLYIEPESGDGASRFQIRGNEGIIDVCVDRVRLFHSGSGWEEVPLRVPASEVRVAGGPTNGNLVRELIAWIEGGPQHRGAGPTAFATVEIMMALYESARRHHVIHLPLKEEANPLAQMIAEGGLPPDKPGRYDIREFLRRDWLDQDKYQQLRAQGLKHQEAQDQVKKQV